MSLVIRRANLADAAQVASIYRPIVESTAISFEVDPPTADEMRGRIEATLPKYPWLVCAHDAVVAGYAYAGQHRVRAAYLWSVDVSVYIAEAYRRRGAGRALYASLLEMLRAQGFYNAYAGITLPNEGSVRLHESVGFRPLGTYRRVGFKMGRWHDVGWWDLRLQAGDGPPVPPVPAADLPEAEVVVPALARGTDLLVG